jgi:hypothetical protein|tara:strand:+ start:989 stop:1420 length:432 start_codon:yes stop_codon:yes gene_type:complete
MADLTNKKGQWGEDESIVHVAKVLDVAPSTILQMEGRAGKDWPVGEIRHRRGTRIIIPDDATPTEKSLLEEKRGLIKLEFEEYKLPKGSADILKAKGFGKSKTTRERLNAKEEELARKERALEAFEYRLKKLEEKVSTDANRI